MVFLTSSQYYTQLYIIIFLIFPFWMIYYYVNFAIICHGQYVLSAVLHIWKREEIRTSISVYIRLLQIDICVFSDGFSTTSHVNET